MKAIQVHQFGGPEVLALQEIPTPKPGPGEVLVHVHAAGVNPYDTYMRNGTYAVKPPLPYTPGSDAAGTVEAIGQGVLKVKPGDRVYTAKTITGAYAEYALALESQVYPSARKSLIRTRRRSLGSLWDGVYRAPSPCTRSRRRNAAGARRKWWRR